MPLLSDWSWEGLHLIKSFRDSNNFEWENILHKQEQTGQGGVRELTSVSVVLENKPVFKFWKHSAILHFTYEFTWLDSLKFKYHET